MRVVHDSEAESSLTLSLFLAVHMFSIDAHQRLFGYEYLDDFMVRF